VRLSLTEAANEVELLLVLEQELDLLDREDDVETTHLIHPYVLQEFDDFNQFLTDCDRLLVQMDREGVYQIAGFHPHYQFIQTNPEDAENYSNRWRSMGVNRASRLLPLDCSSGWPNTHHTCHRK
jgi:hypothetical protein